MVADSIPSTSYNSAIRKAATSYQNGVRFAATSIVSGKCLVCDGDCDRIANCKRFLEVSIKDRWAKVKTIKACFCCLKTGHRSQNCFYNNRICGVNGCQKRHHKLLHNGPQGLSKSLEIPSNKMNEDIVSAETHRNCHASSRMNNILFQMVPITINGKESKINTYAFVDDGANVSMIDSKLAHQLDLSGKKENLQLQWLISVMSTDMNKEVKT